MIVAFDTSHGRSSFDDRDNLVLWPGASVEEIKQVLEQETRDPSLKTVA